MRNQKILMFLLALFMGQFAYATALKGISADVQGNGGEEYTCLFDGLTSTKWCARISTWPTHIVFSTLNEDAISISAYRIATGNDDASYTGRRLKKWSLEGSNDKSTWTTLDTRDNTSGNLIKAANQTYYTFTLSSPSAAYKYFRLTIESNMNQNDAIQMSEIDLTVSNCTHPSTTTVKKGSCTDGGSTIETLCAVCGTSISETDVCTTHVPHKVGELEDGTCEKCNDVLCMEGGVMVIDNIAKWNSFCQFVNNGNYTLSARLDADLENVTTTVSPYERLAYQGTFDGGGHTMNLNLVADHGSFALFSNTNAATIKNLHLTGSIDGSTYVYVAPLVAYASGLTVIDRVWSSVNITTSRADDGTYGGIVSRNNSAQNSAHKTTITNCLFDGSLVGAGLYANAGIMGYSHEYSTSEIKNCLVVANMQTQTKNCATITRNTAKNAATITNCYYKSTLSAYGTANGTLASDDDMASGQLAYLLNESTNGGVWGQALGTDTYPVPIVTDAMKVYKHTEEGGTTYITNSEAACEHNYVNSKTIAPTCSTQGYDVLVCSICKATSKVNYVDADPSKHVYDTNGLCTVCKTIAPAQQIADEENPLNGYYQIANAGNLKYFADLVNASTDNKGLCAVVTADIDMSVLGNWKPIAYYGGSSNTSGGTGYTGTFDGGNFTLSGMTNKQYGYYSGLFSKVDGGTVRNVKLSNVNVQPSNNYVAVLIGDCYNNATVEDCHVLSGSLSNPNFSFNSGFIYYVTSSTVNRCSTNINIEAASYTGGLFCYVKQSVINNCCFGGSFKHKGYAGIFAYNLEASTFNNCYAYCPAITSTSNSSSFGVFAYTASNNNSTLNNCVGYGVGYTKAIYSNSYKLALNNSFVLDEEEKGAFADGRVALHLGDAWGQNVGTDPLPVLGGTKFEHYIVELVPGTTKSARNHTYNGSLSDYTISTADNVLTLTNDPEQLTKTNVIQAPLVGNATAKSLNIVDGTIFGYGNKKITAEQATYTRSIGNTNFQSVVLPFAASKSTLVSAGYTDFYTINNVHQYDDDNDGTYDRTELEVLKVTKDNCTFRQGYPYIFRGQGEHTVTESNAVCSSATTNIDCSNVANKYTFVPTLAGVSGENMYANHYYAMAGGALAQAEDNTVALSPFRWYLSVENRNNGQVDAIDASEVKQITITVVGEETTTGIIMYSADQRESYDATYDLMGRRVTNNTRGIHIVNGKKVLFK